MRETASVVGERLKRARNRAGLSQIELATRIGKQQAAISQWEQGRRLPGVDDLVRVARVLGMSPGELLPEEEDAQPSGHLLLRAMLETIQTDDLELQLNKFIDKASSLPPLPKRITVASDRPPRAAQDLLARATAHGVGGTVEELPVDVEELANLCGVLVLRELFSDGLSGLLVTLDSGAAIGVNRKHSPGRQRFTIAHELGHYLLVHYDRFHLDLPSAEAGESPYFDWRLEREANEFAADVLMPASLVEECHRAGSDSRALAERFGVSEIAMGYRLINLGLATA